MRRARDYAALIGFLLFLAWAILHCSSQEKLMARSAVEFVQMMCGPEMTVKDCAELVLDQLPDRDAGAD